ncbi:hypothetical protein ACW0S4_04205 [Fusobacterium polymorphum]|jgi:hypothetical protein|uniref:hypothetical protein n=1 Tax=Fusobacterium nucleatum subsp. polymorphum TaxID=76857 RepID=UPI002060C4E4|nr:MAG TPA: hypothetical protein [Caudoviricetes sp.]
MSKTNELNFNEIVSLNLEEQKEVINQKMESENTDGVIINFGKKDFSKEDIKPIFSYIIETSYEKPIILRNVTDENYRYIKKLQYFYEVIKEDEY